VSQRENVVAMTEDDNAGQLPGAGDASAGTAVSADEMAAGASDAGDAAQPGEPGQQDEPAGSAGPVADDTGDAPEADGDDEEALDRPARAVADLEQESEIAADYVEGLLDVADLDGDIDMDVEGDRALVSVVGATLQELVGPHGEVLEALQELTRLAVHRQTGVRTRIMLDVGGYRARRRTELTALGRDAAEDVSRTGVPRRLDPMTPFERKIIHDAVAAAGLHSESEGEEPNRRVVVLPAG
jgi:spoIIIJ-associated protein